MMLTSIERHLLAENNFNTDIYIQSLNKNNVPLFSLQIKKVLFFQLIAYCCYVLQEKCKKYS